MSQNENKFQSKNRGSRENFGGRERSGGKFGENRGERPAGGGFRRSFDGDARPPRGDRGDFGGDRAPRRDRDGDRSDRPARGKPFEKREFGRSDSRPSRGGDRPSGDNPYKKREFSDRPPRKEFGDRPPRREFGDRPPRKEFGDRPPRREFGDRPPRKEFGDRPPRKEFGDRPPRKEFGDRPPRREFGARPPRKDFGDRKPYNREERSDRPQRDFAPRFEERAPATAETRQKLKSDRPSYGSPSSAYLYGVHAVTQALMNNQRKNNRLLCTEKAFEELQEAWDIAASNGMKMPTRITVEKEDIERLLPRDAVHQDMLLDCQPLEETSLHEYLLTAPEDAKVLILDQVTDPHNVGAILRSAAAFGAGAVIMQTLHAPEVTGVLAKTASGALEHVPMLREVNLSRALEQLKKAGFFCIGLAEEGKQSLAQLNLTGKTALVLGAEGPGIRRLVAENCDELVHLPTQGPIGSLNVSNAAAVALYELVRK